MRDPHPAVFLLSWLSLSIAFQFMGGTSLLCAGVLLLLAGRRVLFRWWGLLRRSKWLLLTLWLVLAYSVPGLLWQGFAWAPTLEGVAAASQHALRLVVLLGALALMLTWLDRQKLALALWVLARKLLSHHWADRSVVRLLLVLDYVDHAPLSGSWKALLMATPLAPQQETVLLVQQAWRQTDSLLLGCVIILGILGAR